MKVHEYREMMRYLTRPATPVVNDRVEYSEGSKLTGTDKTLEQNIRDDHKAFNDYRKSIGQGPIPLDNEYIRMWIRSRLSEGGRVKLKDGTKEPQKTIPMDLESVAFRLFGDKLDNLTYNQKQTLYDHIEDRKNKKALGGRVKFKNGSEESSQEIPSLGETDTRGILQQQIINEKDPNKINELVKLLEEYDKRQLEKQKEKEEFKKSQKEKGIKYEEDFPSTKDYLLETGKQLLTNPKYTLGKAAKGAIEGTEFLAGQFGRSFLGIGKTDPSKSPLENLFYTPVLGEKLKINKLIEEGTPKDPTTGTLLGGDVLEIGAGFLGPYEAYLLSKAAKKGVGTLKTKSVTEVDEKIDPARRDILKTGAVMTGGAVLYPTAKKIGMFDDLAKGVKVVRTLPEVKGMPEWFNPFITRIENEGLDITSQARKAQKLEYERFGGPPSNAADREIVQSKKFEIPVSGKKESEIITMTEYKNGDFYVESNTSGGAFNSPFDLYYTAPKEVTETQFLRGKDGKVYEKKVIVKKEGDFVVIEQRPYASPRYMFDDQNVELEYMEMSLDDTISDVEKLEKIATGKKIDSKKIEQRTKNRKFVEENPMEDVVNRQGDPDPDYDYAYKKFSNDD